MLSVGRVALAAALSLAFVASATAQGARHERPLGKAFTSFEKAYFARASLTVEGHGGGSGDGAN